MEPSGTGMNPSASPVDRMDALAQRLSERAAALKKVADAAKPFYASLDESQKRLFGMLGGHLLMMGHGHYGMGMMGGMGMIGRDGMGMGMMDRGDMGMGMMGREPGGMNTMGKPSNDGEDNLDDE